MLTARVRKSDYTRSAYEVKREDGPFQCPECGELVILRRPTQKIHHFAHKRERGCAWGAGESNEHQQAKLAFYKAFKTSKYCDNTALEWRIAGRVADVLTNIGGSWVAVEVQRSHLSLGEMTQRTRDLNSKGIHLLWVSVRPSWVRVDPVRAVLREVETSILDWYGGFVYSWAGAAAVIDVREPRTATSYVEHSEWYTPDGDLETAGGYEYTLDVQKDLHIVAKATPVTQFGPSWYRGMRLWSYGQPRKGDGRRVAT